MERPIRISILQFVVPRLHSLDFQVTRKHLPSNQRIPRGHLDPAICNRDFYGIDTPCGMGDRRLELDGNPILPFPGWNRFLDTDSIIGKEISFFLGRSEKPEGSAGGIGPSHRTRYEGYPSQANDSSNRNKNSLGNLFHTEYSSRS